MVRVEDISKVTQSVTSTWTKQRKREERQSRARCLRSEYMYSSRVNQSDVAEDVIPRAYSKASDNGRLPAHARQIFYAARKEIQDRTDRTLESTYFTQTLLPKFISQHPDLTSGWWVVYDARGHFVEPHTNLSVPLGTLDVDRYLKDIDNHTVAAPSPAGFEMQYPTKGPGQRFSAILFIEKEGFNPLFKETKLAERYDIAIMSTKGQSVVAARRLVDHLCHAAGVPVLVLHDFDKQGFEIAQNLTSVSDAAYESGRVRYEFENEINVIDLGLRLKDVEKWRLESESVRFKGRFQADTIATQQEQEFLRSDRRVELNAFTSPDFIAWIEAGLKRHGIKKVVPNDETMAEAYRRAFHVAYVNRELERLNEEAEEATQDATIPRGLKRQVCDRLASDPEKRWDDVVAKIAESRVSEHNE